MTLQHRISDEERSPAVAQAEWDERAEPIIERLDRALDDYAATGLEWHLKDMNVARRDLALLGLRPAEGLRLAQLRSRLWRQQNGGAA